MPIGRCSNQPEACENARLELDLPYAGPDSVCPLCRSPLALVGEPLVTTAQPTASSWPDAEAQHFGTRSLPPSGTQMASETKEPSALAGSAMNVTRWAAIAALIILVGFIAWRAFGPKPDNSAWVDPSGLSANSEGLAIEQISPPQLRRVIEQTAARVLPDSESAQIMVLPVDTILDVTGKLSQGAQIWLRVTLPTDRSRSGFVREDHLDLLGEGEADYSSLDPTAGNTINSVVMPVAPVQLGPMALAQPITFQILKGPATIFQTPAADGVPMGNVAEGMLVNVIAQQTVAGVLFNQVQLTNGRTGWILGSAGVSLTPVGPTGQAGTAGAGVLPNGTSGQDGIVPPDPAESAPPKGPMAVSVGTLMRVDGAPASLRARPGVTSEAVLEVLPVDTLMPAEDVRIVAGVPWYQVTSPKGNQGWLPGRALAINQ
ncbi:hypothetical protein PbB2_00871 [Candidatus Phycosocius bacilliformis]|uniref:SH3b domain-containing protein n=2 Tax=Candidatus Phycosocius bacilliformis TaxID=1445552 RepID=A0A2P2E833_9PROT|nr:hypothetical protein PbB2_00871 [Candidatus Phycosocius bacilliformis]